MSITVTKEQTDAAADTVTGEVYVPSFRSKLASCNMDAHTQEELVALLELGSQLRQQYDQAQSKTASSRVDVIRNLTASLGGRPAKTPARSLSKSASVNPAIAAAVFNLSLAEASV